MRPTKGEMYVAPALAARMACAAEKQSVTFVLMPSCVKIADGLEPLSMSGHLHDHVLVELRELPPSRRMPSLSSR
jgi:hypothetical protein